MKKIVLLLALCSIFFIANCQDKENIQAQIFGHKPNDTISIDDFLNIGELSLNNNDYVIESFGLDFIDSGFFREFSSSSNKLTDEMKNAISNLKKRNMKTTKIFFEKIRVKSPQGKILTIGGLLHVLKINGEI